GPPPQEPVGVHLGKPQVRERQPAERRERRLDARAARADIAQQPVKRFLVHGRPVPGVTPCPGPAPPASPGTAPPCARSASAASRPERSPRRSTSTSRNPRATSAAATRGASASS